MRRVAPFLAACVVVVSAAGLWAQQADSIASTNNLSQTPQSVPRLIMFSGTVKDLTGKPLTGPVDLNFDIYKEQADAAPLWQESQTLNVDEQGHYTALLGAMQPEGLPVDLFTSGEARWLGVSAGKLPEQPRVLLVSVPYALKANDAEMLAGKPASAYMLAPPAGSATSQGPGTAGTTGPGGAATSELAAPGKPKSGAKPNLTGTGTQNYIPMWTDSAGTLGNSVIYQKSGLVGIGTTTPAARLDVAGSVGHFLVDTSGAQFRFTRGGANYFQASTAGGYFDFVVNGLTPSDANASLKLAVNGDVDFMAGKVGIGTTAPVSALNVAGTTGLTWTNGANNLGLATFGTPGTGGSLYINTPSANSTYQSGLGIDGTYGTPSYQSVINIRALGVHSGGWYGSQLAFWTTNGTGLNQQMTIDKTGNVGIGTTTPARKLDVAGDINASSNITAGGNLTVTGTITGNIWGLTAVNLPQTTGASTGIIYLGGSPFLHACCNPDNTFVGSNAGNLTPALGGHHTAIGFQALHALTTGYANTASGYYALLSNTSGSYNTASGDWALQANTTGSYNTASGVWALVANTTGWGNTAIGESALYSNTTGYKNTASGEAALIDNLTGSNNTASGNGALAGNASGSGNTAIGGQALSQNCASVSSSCTGNNNTAVGTDAGLTATTANANVTGANNTFIGAYSGPGTSTEIDNAAAIGANAVVSASNALVLGSINGVNGATASVNVGIGTATPGHVLDVVGDIHASSNITTGGVFTGNGSGLTNVSASAATTAAGLSCTGCVGNTQLGVSYAGSSSQGGAASNALLLNGLASSAFQPTGSYAVTTGPNSFTGNQTVSGGNVGIGTASPPSLLSVGSSSQFQVNSSGIVTAYGGEATAGNGLAATVGSADYTNQTATIGPVGVYTVPTGGGGVYLVMQNATVHGTGTGKIAIAYTWTDQEGAKNQGPDTLYLASSASAIGDVFCWYLAASSTVTYTVTYTATGSYDYSFRLVKIK